MPITYANKKVFLNGLEVSDFEVDGINTRDYPDFCDAYIADASVLENGKWREATEQELDELSENRDLVYEEVQSFLF